MRPGALSARDPFAQAQAHHVRTGRLLGADILDVELADGSRVVIRGRHWTACVPYAARWPVEVHLAPDRDVPDLASLDRFYDSADGEPIDLPYIAACTRRPG